MQKNDQLYATVKREWIAFTLYMYWQLRAIQQITLQAPVEPWMQINFKNSTINPN